MRFVYKSKYNHKRNNQVILLIINDGEKWHYLTVRSLSALLRRITSNHNGDFYCLNCLHSYRTKNKLKNMKNYVTNMITAMRKCLNNTTTHYSIITEKSH